MFKWLKTRRTEPVSAVNYEQMQNRMRATLKALALAERRFKDTTDKHQKALDKMSEEMAKIILQYDWAMDDAKTTIAKYEKQVDALRDEIRVNERTIETLDASVIRFQQHWKTEAAIEVQREVGAQHNGSGLS